MNLNDITPLVLTFNEAPNIGRCLGRLEWASRVVVLDSGSADETRNIAQSCANVDFISRSFDNHTAQWNHGIDAVESEWVLALDADYVLGDGFENELLQLAPAPDTDACFARFKYVIFGKPLRGSLYPPRAVLFRKSRCRYEPDGHTQLLHVSGGTEFLKSVIMHDDRKPLSRWLQSQDKYAKLEAIKLLSEPRSALRLQDRLRLALVPAVPLTLCYTLFVKGAALDGWRGWYYALQRTVAEVMLSLRLLEKRIEGDKP